jgi:hypothetical protein
MIEEHITLHKVQQDPPGGVLNLAPKTDARLVHAASQQESDLSAF